MIIFSYLNIFLRVIWLTLLVDVIGLFFLDSLVPVWYRSRVVKIYFIYSDVTWNLVIGWQIFKESTPVLYHKHYSIIRQRQNTLTKVIRYGNLLGLKSLTNCSSLCLFQVYSGTCQLELVRKDQKMGLL